MFLAAEEFQLATEHVGRGVPKQRLLASPFLVSAAFTIELYLKCLQQMSLGEYEAGNHKLSSLFNRLPDSLKPT